MSGCFEKKKKKKKRKRVRVSFVKGGPQSGSLKVDNNLQEKKKGKRQKSFPSASKKKSDLTSCLAVEIERVVKQL